MAKLSPNTYYRIELRAHNAIGFSTPASILMRTARGESDSTNNNLGTLLYTSGFVSSANNNYNNNSNLRSLLLNLFCVVTVVALSSCYDRFSFAHRRNV